MKRSKLPKNPLRPDFDSAIRTGYSESLRHPTLDSVLFEDFKYLKIGNPAAAQSHPNSDLWNKYCAKFLELKKYEGFSVPIESLLRAIPNQVAVTYSVVQLFRHNEYLEEGLEIESKKNSLLFEKAVLALKKIERKPLLNSFERDLLPEVSCDPEKQSKFQQDLISFIGKLGAISKNWRAFYIDTKGFSKARKNYSINGGKLLLVYCEDIGLIQQNALAKIFIDLGIFTNESSAGKAIREIKKTPYMKLFKEYFK